MNSSSASVVKKNVLVTGANGQLAGELKKIKENFPNLSFFFLSKEELPIQQVENVRTAIEKYNPDFIVNCAAYTAVDKAEEDKEQAFLVNKEGAKNLALAAKEADCYFIHISTDYVFDGEAVKPYTEEATTNPKTIYGLSKREGELAVLKYNQESIVIRTSWLYSSTGKNFVKTMLRLMKEKSSINVVNDQVGSPTYAADLAKAIMAIINRTIEANSVWVPGIYHYANVGAISWFDFALAIRNNAALSCVVHPISSQEYPTAAARPAYSVLNSEKIKEKFGVDLCLWQDSLKDCLQAIDLSA